MSSPPPAFNKDLVVGQTLPPPHFINGAGGSVDLTPPPPAAPFYKDLVVWQTPPSHDRGIMYSASGGSGSNRSGVVVVLVVVLFVGMALGKMALVREISYRWLHQPGHFIGGNGHSYYHRCCCYLLKVLSAASLLGLCHCHYHHHRYR